MASLLNKIRSFFKRKPSEDVSSSPTKKRLKYTSTPGVTFTPTQIESKRRKRSYYCYREVISVTEDRNFEFKAGGGLVQMDILRDYVRKYGSAFLNAEGGVLLGGILDNGIVQGVRLNSEKITRITHKVDREFAEFRPVVRPDKYRLSFVPVWDSYHPYEHDLYIIELYIDKGDPNAIYENSRHEVMMRRDGGVQGPLRPLAIKDLVLRKRAEAAKEASVKKNFEEIVTGDDNEEKRIVTKIDSSLEIIEEAPRIKKPASNNLTVKIKRLFKKDAKSSVETKAPQPRKRKFVESKENSPSYRKRRFGAVPEHTRFGSFVSKLLP
eukprot:gene19952-21906_t